VSHAKLREMIKRPVRSNLSVPANVSVPGYRDLDGALTLQMVKT